jgi:SAM-dependent methyltransferase
MVKPKDKRQGLPMTNPEVKPSSGLDGFLSSYYETSTGRIVRHLILGKLKPVLTSLYPAGRDDLAIATMGYMRPYMQDIADHYPHVINLHTIGGLLPPWPPAESGKESKNNRSRQALAEASSLPLLDASLDGLFIIHGLELASSPQDMVAEIWRVLKSQGSVVLVIPHRGSIWASRDDTPFGLGQPFSMNQIKSLLKDHDFEVGKVHRSLMAPPSSSGFYRRYAPFVERLPYPFGGVLIVEARKMIYSVRGQSVINKKQVGDLVKARSVSPSRHVSHRDNGS